MKKKIQIVAATCMVGICGFGQQVYAGEFMTLSQNISPQLEQMVQRKILKEQREYLLQARLVSKINLEKRIEEKAVSIPNSSHEVTQRERTILERIVEAEATGKDKKSKVLVANVIFNRVKSKEFPNSIEEVVFQRVQGQVQFSPVADGRYEKVAITKSTKKSVDLALEGKDYSKGALYFVEKTIANPRNVSWFEKALTRLFTYEGHSFYK